MLLTISTTHRPATDLGYLLHKHPARHQTVDLSFGRAHVFYTSATEERCTAALLLDVDPVGLVRGRDDGSLYPYVNDRPYVASSLLSVALGRTFGTAMGGRSKERQELAEQPIPLVAELSVLPCRGGEALLRALFEPVGWTVEAEPLPLDPSFPAWGDSRYFRVTLTGTQRLADLLAHLYVLVPVLDDHKHYWVGQDEIDKLLERGGEWLQEHPERDLIVKRYLKHQRGLARRAIARLDEASGDPEEDAEAAAEAGERMLERPLRLNDVRMERVAEELAAGGARRVIDLGCGEGRLIAQLRRNAQFDEIVGVDVSAHGLARAARKLRLDDAPPHQRDRIRLLQGSLVYQDARLSGFDAAALVEVVEHVDPWRLPALEGAVFGTAAPARLVVTTPNVEYNTRFTGMAAGQLRHRDHRFEWTREQFRVWARGVAERYGYSVRFKPVGEVDPEVGAPTQMGVFER